MAQNCSAVLMVYMQPETLLPELDHRDPVLAPPPVIGGISSHISITSNKRRSTQHADVTIWKLTPTSAQLADQLPRRMASKSIEYRSSPVVPLRRRHRDPNFYDITLMPSSV